MQYKYKSFNIKNERTIYPFDWKQRRFFSILSRIISIKSFRRKLFKHSALRSLPLAPLLPSPPIPSTVRPLRRLLFRKLASLPTDRLRMRAWHASFVFCLRDLDFRINFRTLGLPPLPSIALPSIGHRALRQRRQQMPLLSNVKSIFSFFVFGVTTVAAAVPIAATNGAHGSDDGQSGTSAPSEPRCVVQCARRCDDSCEADVSMCSTAVAVVVAAVVVARQHVATRLSVISFDAVRAALFSNCCRSVMYTFDLHWVFPCTSHTPVEADADAVAVAAGWIHGASAVAKFV